MNAPAPLPYAHGGPVASGRIKLDPEDFLVDEILGFEPSGEGEHVFLHIEKRGENTDYLARQLTRYAGVTRMAVSYAGMKDRHGRASQWFSVHLPGKVELDWSGFNSETVRVLTAVRHNRKLKKGTLKGNRFEITVRELNGSPDSLTEKLGQIVRDGIPNYFGPQRFGRDAQNLQQAEAFFQGEFKPRDRHLEAILLSTARAFIFNTVLATRVEAGLWNQAIDGDVFMFSGSHSFFKDALSDDIRLRIASHNIHPSGPLWGKGELETSAAALDMETTALQSLAVYREGLERAGMERSRRPLRLSVPDLRWNFPDATTLKLEFSLPAGAYATVVLREAIQFEGDID